MLYPVYTVYTVYTIQPVFKPVEQPVGQPVECLVYTMQPVIQPIEQPVEQPAVSCIQTFKRLNNRLFNRLYWFMQPIVIMFFVIVSPMPCWQAVTYCDAITQV